MTREPSADQASEQALAAPSTERLLDEVLTLGREVHLEMDEPALVERFLASLAVLFPGRAILVRALDPRSPERARCYVMGAELQKGVDTERITLTESSVAKSRLKSAVMKSARIRISSRWDSPFPGIAAGFTIPLVASGELYGALDVGYPLGHDLGETDKPLILPLANYLSVALRNERLYRDTTMLRDYQAKLIEHANALILGVDRSWRITVCNHALCQLAGSERDQVIGRDVRDWLHGDDIHQLTAVFQKALSGALGGPDDTTATSSVQVTLRTCSAPVRTIWSVAPVGGRGRIEAVVAVGQDQTKLFELERQIIQAEKLATLGQLAAGVVHELNNPLTSISVYADYLLGKLGACLDTQQPLRPEAGDVEKLRRIVASAQRIGAFARDLVQYARPGGNERGAIELNTVVLQSLSFCEHLFERSGIELIQSLAAALPPVNAVPGQLEQVVINLITNAAQALGGRGRVTLQTYRPGPGRVALSVADSGPGIPSCDRDRIFEPFFTTKSNGEGTGLGLSIVRNIVEQHGGTISVNDADGGGAMFVMILPAAR